MVAPVESPPTRTLPPKVNGKWRKTTADGHANLAQSRPALIRDALELQVEMKKQALDPKTPVHHKAACVRAWADLAERIRILRGQPLPGQLRPELANKGKSGRKARPRLEPMTAPVTPLQVVPHPGAPSDNTGETDAKQASNA